MAHIRRKLEPDPRRPRYFITEPGMGYRFELPASLGPADPAGEPKRVRATLAPGTKRVVVVAGATVERSCPAQGVTCRYYRCSP